MIFYPSYKSATYMAKRFFIFFALIFLSMGISVAQDISLTNRAFPNNHPIAPGNTDQNNIFACSDEPNTFEYIFQSLVPSGGANLEFNQIQFTLPEGYTYLPGTMGVNNGSGVTMLPAASVTTQPDPIGNGVLLTANLGSPIVTPGTSLTILFQSKLDCRTYNGQASLNFIPLTLSYIKNSVASQFVLDNSQNNANSFDILIPLMQPSYTGTPTGPLVAFRDYTRQLNIINTGGGETKKFKLYYQIPNNQYNGLFKIRSLTGVGASIVPTGVPYEYDVTLVTPLASGQQLTFTEVFYEWKFYAGSDLYQYCLFCWVYEHSLHQRRCSDPCIESTKKLS